MLQRRGDPAEAHRGAGGMGRLPRAAAEADRHRCNPPSPAASAHWVRSSTPPPTTCAARAPTSATPIIKLSQAFSALGDHSNDIFTTVKNLSILVSALQDSTDLLRQLNENLASVTALFSNDPDEVGQAVNDLNDVVGDVQQLRRRQPRDAGHHVGQAGVGHPGTRRQPRRHQADAAHRARRVPELPQHLPAGPGHALPAPSRCNNFANPITFLCGAIQAASRLGAEQSAKLCVQYLAPIVKNRQYNFPPLGENLFVGAQARPNELTYSEDWMRPDYVPPPGDQALHRRPPASADASAGSRRRRRQPRPPTPSRRPIQPTVCPA